MREYIIAALMIIGSLILTGIIYYSIYAAHEPDTTEVIIHAEQGIECVIDEVDEIRCSLTEKIK